jgi:integrase
MVAKTWTIPKERMKAKREHVVPLSAAAIKVLADLGPLQRPDGFVFPGMRAGKPLSNMGMLTTLARMGRSDLTVHGFRSTFRDWVAERTNFPGEVAEAALAHTIENATEAAYRRGDLLEKRRKLMEAWARFITTPAGLEAVVVPINNQTMAKHG